MNSIIRHLVICYCFFIRMLVYSNSILAQCNSSGPLSGSAFLDDNTIGVFAFSSPANAAASDNNRATASALISVLTGDTHYLEATGFGFSIPAYSTICGIVVEVEKSGSNISPLAWISDNSIRLIKNGSITGNNYSKNAQWTSTDTYDSYGSTTDQWGVTWTPADINAPDFGVAFSASINGIIGLLPIARIDHIRITVYYLDVPLPLSIIDFSARAFNDHSARLVWTITNDNKERLLNIQRSSDGHEWTTIYDQQGGDKGSNTASQYTDINCHTDIAYYRMRIEEARGKVSYSQIETVKWQNNSSGIYPNPATGHVFIEQKEPLQFIKCISTDGRQWPVFYRQMGDNKYEADTRLVPRGACILFTNEQKKLILLQ